MNVLDSATDFSDLVPHIEHPHWTALCAAAGSESGWTTAQVQAFDLWRPLRDARLLGRVQQLFDHVKKQIAQIAQELQIDAKEIAACWSTRPMYAFLRACRFSLLTLYKPLAAFAALYRAGILHVFTELHRTGALQRLNAGAIHVDQLLAEQPLLRKLMGPAVAGLLVWMFVTANFTGDPKLDMDLTSVINAALHGDWSAADLFTSPQGLAALTLLITSLGGITFPTPVWLNTGVPLNLLTALVYTGYRHVAQTATTRLRISELKTHIKFARL